jgi:hypothetical protein
MVDKQSINVQSMEISIDLHVDPAARLEGAGACVSGISHLVKQNSILTVLAFLEPISLLLTE